MNLFRNLLSLLFVLSLSVSIYAQDVIVKKGGSTVLAKVLEINPTDVKYKKYSNQDGPTYTINKDDIMVINYENGEMDDFSKAETPKQQPNNTVALETTQEDKDANTEVLRRMMGTIATYNGKPKQSKAVLLYCMFKPTAESTVADANVELSFHTALPEETGNDIPCADETFFIATIQNKTNKTIYLDMANSFFVRGSQSEPYYVPTATSATAGSSASVGVNVGQLSGIGGNLNGLSVGSGSTQYNTTITYSQRIMAIPPMSSFDFPVVRFFPENEAAVNKYSDFEMKKRTRYGGNAKLPHIISSVLLPQTIGAVEDYAEGVQKFNFSVFVTYAFTEDMSKVRSLNTKFNIRRIIGIPEKKMLGIVMGSVKSDAISPTMANEVYTIMWQDN